MADERQHTRMSELLSMQIGQAGVDTITNTSATTPGGDSAEWFAMQAVGDTVISAIAEQDAALNGSIETDTLAGATLTDGTIIYGSFTSVTLTSGILRCYREPIA